MKNDYIYSSNKSVQKTKIPNFLSGFNSSLDESVLPLSTAKRIYNFDFQSGALTTSYGIIDAEFPRTTVAVWQYKKVDSVTGETQKIKMFTDTGGHLWYFNERGFATVLSGIRFTSAPIAINYRLYGEDVIIMCSKTDGMLVWDGVKNPYFVENSPLITSFTIHYERMFATTSNDKSMVIFSDDLDPTNWNSDLDSGGFIQMLDERGELNKVISFLNYVYIFRDYGISRLTAYADQSEFSATNLFVSSGKISSKTVTECGDTVLFVSGSGIYRFDGMSTTKLLPSISGIIKSSENAVAAYHKGKYFVALHLNLDNGIADDSLGNNGMIIYDIKSGNYQVVSGVNIVSLVTIDEELFAITDLGRVGKLEKCGAFFNEKTIKRYSSGMQDYGTDNVKTVKEFSVETKEPLNLTVFSEKIKKTFKVPSSNDGISIVRVNVTGRKIGFEIETDSLEPKISRPTIKMNVKN